MADFPFEIIGFDLDGTLLDTSPELTAAVNHALHEAGHPPLTQEEVKPMVGLGAKNMLKFGLERVGGGRDELDTYLPILLDYYGEHLGEDSPPYPGLLDAMARFDELGVKMAVVTNKYERFAVRLLEKIGMIGRFRAIIGSDTLGRGADGQWLAKPDRAPMDEMVRRCGHIPGDVRAAFIGDSIYDVMAAHNADMHAIAAGFGFLHQPAEELRADAIIGHYDDFIPALETLAEQLSAT